MSSGSKLKFEFPHKHDLIVPQIGASRDEYTRLRVQNDRELEDYLNRLQLSQIVFSESISVASGLLPWGAVTEDTRVFDVDLDGDTDYYVEAALAGSITLSEPASFPTSLRGGNWLLEISASSPGFPSYIPLVVSNVTEPSVAGTVTYTKTIHLQHAVAPGATSLVVGATWAFAVPGGDSVDKSDVEMSVSFAATVGTL